MEDEFIKILLYGKNRVGKTTLACQFEKPALLISFEPTSSGGATSVKRVPGVDVIKIREKDKAIQLARELQDDTKYRTHILDSATSLQEVVLASILNLAEAPVQLNWGKVSRDEYRERSEITKEVLKLFLDLKVHTVVCAKERDHNAKDKEAPKPVRGVSLDGAIDQETMGSWIAADLGGATVGYLNDTCDYLGRLYIDHEMKEVVTEIVVGKKTERIVEWHRTGKLVRRLRTMYHPNFGTGFRSCTPDKVPEFIENPTYEKILKVIRGEDL